MPKLATAGFLNKWVTQPVAYTTRDLLLYAQGIGCTALPYVYEHDDAFAAFPTYPIVLAFTGTDEDVVSFPSEAMGQGPKMPPLEGVVTGVDGERFLEVITPLPTEGSPPKLTLKSAIVGVHKRGSGASVETEAVLFDADTGVEYTRMTSGTFLVGATNFENSGTTFSEKIKPPTRAPDRLVELPTSPAQAQLYRLSGDYNPLHVSPEFAKMVGFKQGCILHGLCTLGFSARAVLRAYGGNDPANFRSIKLRFSKPVLPGQTLVVEMWDLGSGRIVFQTKVKETGAVVINNAVFQMRQPVAKL